MTTPPPPDAMAFLLHRRSTPARALGAPYPDAATVTRLLTAAARVPDHGVLEPWRFMVLGAEACARLATLMARIGTAQGHEPEKLAKQASIFGRAGLVVAVISTPRPSPKVPVLEQQMSAGAVCLSLVNAAQASGFGANWLTGWVATDRDFLDEGLGVCAPDLVAGFIHLGTPQAPALPDRARPDIAALTDWVHD